MNDDVNSEQQGGNADLGLIGYICYGVALVFPVAIVVGLAIAYTQRPDANATWRESHFDWLIRTFWYGLGFGFLAAILTAISLGILSGIVFGLLVIWYVVRLYVGWSGYSKQIPIANPDSPFF